MTSASITQNVKQGSETQYWHTYFSREVIERSNQLRQAHKVASQGVDLHVDVYPRPEPNAPVVIFNHGGGGYARLFTTLALTFYDRGYTVILPDQKSNGMSGGDKGDFTISESVQSIVDVAQWARQRFAGPLFLAGGSMGGGLAYNAAAALAQKGTPPAAVVALNLWDYSDPRTPLAVSRFAPLANIPGVPQISRAVVATLGRILPRLRLPWHALGIFEHMLDERDIGFFERWKRDPYPLQSVTLRLLASMSTTPPAIPYEQNRLPVLVINQLRDKMVHPKFTQQSYERLSGPKKYVEIDWGHFSMQPKFLDECATLYDEWFQAHK